jgi:Amiloride-sensitive sodium channel
VEEQQKFLSYRMHHLFCDLGGLVGLFLGCSLISFIELAYNIFMVIARDYEDESNYDGEDTEDPQEEEYHFTPIMKRRKEAWGVGDRRVPGFNEKFDGKFVEKY